MTPIRLGILGASIMGERLLRAALTMLRTACR